MGDSFFYHSQDDPSKSYSFSNSQKSEVYLTWSNHKESSFSVPRYHLFPWVEIIPKSIISKVKVDFNPWTAFKDPNNNPWVNRLVHGDSLCGMASLVRSGFKDNIQMIYFDPPFGIAYQASFDIAGETTEGYQDRWENGLGSYLEYMRQRLVLCRELLHPTGSIFVQIGETNMHYVRCILDEIFGAENAISVITFRTAVSTNNIKSVADYLLWYAKDSTQIKRKQLYTERSEENLAGTFTYSDKDPITGLTRVFKPQEIINRIKSKSQKTPRTFPISINNKSYYPPEGFEWKWEEVAMNNLVKLGRIAVINDKLYGKRFIDDFPDMLLTNIWTDTSTSTFAARKHYAVKTNPKVIRRCIAATTEYGDIVLDPTCGSGTTSNVAEEMERRWITFDTSPSAILLTMSWILSSSYPIYQHATNPDDLVYQTIPQFSLSDLAQNRPLKQANRHDLPKIIKKEGRVASSFQILGLEYEFKEDIFEIEKYNRFLISVIEKNGVLYSNNSVVKISPIQKVQFLQVDSFQIGLWETQSDLGSIKICCFPPLCLTADILTKTLKKLKNLIANGDKLWILSMYFHQNYANVLKTFAVDNSIKQIGCIIIHPDLLMQELLHSNHPEAFRFLEPSAQPSDFAVKGQWEMNENSTPSSIQKINLDYYQDYISPLLKSDLGLPIEGNSTSGLSGFVKVKTQNSSFFIDKRGTWHF